MSGIKESSESLNTFTLIAIAAAAVAAGMLIIGLLYFIAKQFPIIMGLYELLRDKLIFGAILTFYIKSYLKLFTNSFAGYMDESKPED